ncbi:DUF2188 domain-containing protein [Rhodococcus sp. LW-XY12]|uniref:DUF2188 domain-containing protein n=1 Tax=Rhodococcus sp. LW-XY12 TaxID=2856851 RepID=UPI001C571320|nr:DUF2188 domain-containing protein [Rhodococcus sp. LW-XY12]QXU56685.1 DUF2188 domain-containing protein [Rhodococcus sp. LW-XY12]
MTQKKDAHVVPNGSAGWRVVRPNSSRASAVTATQAQAISRASEIVGRSGGGEVHIHGRSGQVREKNTIAPGNDSFPPRG